MAPLTRRLKKTLAAASPGPVIDPADRISRLPEEIQAQILSFLPAQESVRTCVLARTWRHVWRFTRRLLITGKSVREVRKSVGALLRVRHHGLKLASLDASEIRFDPWVEELEDDEQTILGRTDMYSIQRWIRRVLRFQIQTLRVDISARADLDVYLEMSTTSLVSRHLTRLELTGIFFDGRCINLDGCPGLKHLEINECCLVHVRKISSLSLKRLVITSCESNEARNRIWICVPRLVSLLLDGNRDLRTPLLERMPELVGAKVQINSRLDCCSCEEPMACYHVMGNIDSDSDGDQEVSGDYAGENTTRCVVLEGLAQAKDLVLIADRSTYIFRRDLRWCLIFSKLKTLVLNDYWCESTDCSALACMLQHAPLLEKLTILLCNTVQLKYDVVVEGRPDAAGKSTMISQHLKIVEVKYFEVDQGLLNNLLNFLGSLNIWFPFRAIEGSR